MSHIDEFNFSVSHIKQQETGHINFSSAFHLNELLIQLLKVKIIDTTFYIIYKKS
jgi:hypothetical protein